MPVVHSPGWHSPHTPRSHVAKAFAEPGMGSGRWKPADGGAPRPARSAWPSIEAEQHASELALMRKELARAEAALAEQIAIGRMRDLERE